VTERALPRSEKKITFEAFPSYRTSRIYAALGHAVRVESVRLGSNYRGEPIWSRASTDRALCDTQVNKGIPYEAPVNCKRCLRELRKLELTGRGDAGHGIPEAVAAAEALGRIAA
jgi:hypothetical protein